MFRITIIDEDNEVVSNFCASDPAEVANFAFNNGYAEWLLAKAILETCEWMLNDKDADDKVEFDTTGRWGESVMLIIELCKED